MENNKKLKDDEILIKILSTLKYSANEFAKEIGVTPGSLYHIKNGINKLSVNLSYRIVQRFPEVNDRYLRYGEEPILKDLVKSKEAQLNLFNQKPNLSPFEEVSISLKNIENLLKNILEKIEAK